MKYKVSAIIIFIFLCFLIFPIYYTYKIEYLENEFLDNLESKSSQINILTEELNKNENPQSDKLKFIFDELIKKDESLSAIAITGENSKIKLFIKNDRNLNSKQIINSLLKDIEENLNYNSNHPIIKNYAGTDIITDKLYIVIKKNTKNNLIAIYKFKAEKITKIMILLEIILLISLISAATGISIMLIKRAYILEPKI